MRVISNSTVIAALTVALATSSLVRAEDPKALQTKLESKYALTTINAEGGTVTQGVILKLKKGLTGGTNKCSNDYKDGRVSLGGNVLQRTQCARLPGVAVSATSRGFVPGEQMSVLKIEVKDGITFSLISDPIGDGLRYHADIKFAVAKGATPDMAQADQMIADVFAIAPQDNQQQSDQQGGQQAAPTAAAAPQQQQPAALPDIAPPPPPPDQAGPATTADQPAPQQQPQTLSIGLSIDQVVAILGQPATVADLGAKKIYTYKNPSMKVTFVDGKVTDMQ